MRNDTNTTPRGRRAFTLVELLVVITIIGILIALALPGVMASRESARRVACLDNLRRIGVALSKYEAARMSFPSGTVDAESPVRNVAEGYKMNWLSQLLPYLEERNLYKEIDFSAGVYDEKNAHPRSINVPTFVCPSCGVCRITSSTTPGSDGQWSSVNETDSVPGTWTASNYAGCQGGEETPIGRDNDGVFFLDSRITSDDVTDGLAHTIFVGEKLVGFRDLGWMSGTRATLRNGGTPIDRTPDDGDMLMPPADEASWIDNDLYVGGFGSCHPGICNFLYGDGRTDSITADISPEILSQLCDRAGGEVLEGGPTRSNWW